jgi:hypothetical protein
MERRTTVTAQDDDLAVIANDARRRGISLGRALGELVSVRAEELRRHRRPRVAMFSVDFSIAEAMDSEDENPAAQPFRS